MKEYEVLVTETLERKVKVKANSIKEAKGIIWDMFDNEDLILTEDDFSGVELEVLSEDGV